MRLRGNLGGQKCSKCPVILGDRNYTGMCRKCNNSDPEIIARRAAGISLARRKKLRADPEFAEQQREHGRWLGLTQNGNAHMPPEVRKRSHQKMSDTKLPWCPRDRREEYKKLVRNGGLTPKEARRMIEDTLTPFMRAMEKVRNGAGIRIEPPMPRRVETRTLGGVQEW